MKIKMIEFFFIVSCLLIAGSCADDKSKDSDDDSAGANLTGDGEVIIPDKEIETEVPGIEEGGNSGGEPPILNKPTDLERAIYNEGAYYLSAARTNDYDTKWLEARMTFNEVTEIDFPNNFADLFIFNIESDPKFVGKRLTSDWLKELSDAWVSFSFKSVEIDERIQFCGQPVFKRGVTYSKPVKNYPNYVFADTDHTHGIHTGQQEIVRKWKSGFIAYHNDEEGNIIDCSNAAILQRYKITTTSQSEIDDYFTIAPSTAILKISNGIRISQYIFINPFKKKAGLEVVMKLAPRS